MYGINVWVAARRDVEDEKWLREENVGMIIAAVGEDTDEFVYGMDVEFGAHRCPIQYAGKGHQGHRVDPQARPLRDRSSVVNALQ